MLAKSALLISIIQAALLLGSAEARIGLLERDGRAVFARKFGQQQPSVLKELAAACGGGICDTLADEAVSDRYLLPLDSTLLLSIEDLRSLVFRLLRCWLPNQSVRSKTWLIRSSVCAPLPFRIQRRGLIPYYRRFSPV
jgi:hypothetical protein